MTRNRVNGNSCGVLSNPDFFFLFKFARKRISMDRDDSVS